MAGLNVVVAGYGWCGRGVAMRARGLGGQVIVTETTDKPSRRARGYRVMTMEEAARVGDIFVTVTGNKGVLREEHFRAMKSGAVVCNSGHFNVEIDIPALERLSKGRRMIREFVEEFTLTSGRRVNLLADGRPSTWRPRRAPRLRHGHVLRQQALAAGHGQEHRTLEKRVHPCPRRSTARSPASTRDDGCPDRQHDLRAAALHDSWEEGT